MSVEMTKRLLDLNIAKEVNPHAITRFEQLGIAKDVQALLELLIPAKRLLEPIQMEPYKRTLKFLAMSLMNSSTSVAILCNSGFGIDAMKIARGMFETWVCFKYLLARPEESQDFLDFDVVARYNRLRFHKERLSSGYATFSKSHIKRVNDAFRKVKKRFTDSTGKVRNRWCRHSLAEMARVAGLDLLYDLFYRHASMFNHADPMGLAMLIDSQTHEIQPGPSARHLGVPMRLATWELHDVLHEYSKLIGVDCGDALKAIEPLISGEVDTKGSFLAMLADGFMSEETTACRTTT